MQQDCERTLAYESVLFVSVALHIQSLVVMNVLVWHEYFLF